MNLKNMNDLLLHELQDLASAEQQLIEALPKMAKAAQNDELRGAIEDHLAETERQFERVTDLLTTLGGKKDSKVKCAGMAGIIKEGEAALKDDVDDSIRDAAIIGAAQRVEHYEMAGYGTARTYAEMLGNRQAAQVLEEILEEEKAADEKLSAIAKSVNAEAMEQGENRGEGGDDAEAGKSKGNGSSGKRSGGGGASRSSSKSR